MLLKFIIGNFFHVGGALLGLKNIIVGSKSVIVGSKIFVGSKMHCWV